jgi:hypothetical protein
MSRIGLFIAVLFLGSIQFLYAQSPLPIARTILVESTQPIEAGAVVRYDEASDRYTLSNGISDAGVFGIVAERPAVVFITTATAVPVVSEGVTEVLVTMENGPISRGDVLTTASAEGKAMRSVNNSDAVFAIALEGATEPGLILVQMGVEQAQAARTRLQAAIGIDGGIIVSAARAALAGLLVIGAIGFLLYSFRTIMMTGVISIGRNPRARQSVLFVSVGSMLLAIVLTGLVVFVAIGILILPV